jgi:hypothetical protein
MPPRIPSPANMPPNKTSSKSRSSGVSHANHRFKKKGNGYNNNQKVSFDDVSDAAEFAADSSIFYVPSIEYAFSEQDASSGGYMTSEENHADEDTEDLFAFTSASLDTDVDESTPKKSNSRQDEDQNRGVELNSVMAALLDVSFLPFNSEFSYLDEESGRAIATFQDSLDYFSSDDEGENEDDLDIEDIDDTSICEDLIDLGNPVALGKEGRRKKGPLRKLRRRLNGSPKKLKRKQRRLARAKQKHRDLSHGLSDDIDGEMQKIESGKKLLLAVKSNLRSTQIKGRKLMSEAQQSSNRVNRLSKTVAELEFKFDMAMRSLEKEKSSVDLNLEKLAHLNATEQALEVQSIEIQTKLRNHLNRLENQMSTTPVIHVNGVEWEDLSDAEATCNPRNIRPRANTDGSFMTATEPSPHVNEIIETRGRCSSDSGPNSQGISSVSDSQASMSTEYQKPPGSRLSSFIRIHDLDIAKSLVESSICSRPDVFPIHTDDGHHVLKSLMKLGLKCVTDESDRWVADRSTEKQISKQPPSDDKRYCPSKDETLVWCGTFDHGYKSEVPVIKARALVPTSARQLLDLLFDSSKVKEYNKMSLGREDLHVVKEGIDTDNGFINGGAKICRSVSSVPIIRKQIELLTLMHARALDEEQDGMKGYICVNRSAWEDEKRAPSPSYDEPSPGNQNYIRSEALLGVNLILELDENECEITTINHFYTPGTPSFGAKQFGMKAATNFLRGLQKQFKD